jgi:hypothetical protein
MVTGPVDPWINDYAKMGLNPPVLVHLAIKARSPRFYVMRWPCCMRDRPLTTGYVLICLCPILSVEMPRSVSYPVSLRQIKARREQVIADS